MFILERKLIVINFCPQVAHATGELPHVL